MERINNVIGRVLQTRFFDGVRPKLIRSTAYRLNGKTEFSSSPFSTIILGSKISVEYFSKLFYVDEPTVEFLGKFSFSRFVSFVEKATSDLTIIEANWFFSRFLLDNGSFQSPQMDFVLDINGSFETILNKANEGKRRNLKTVAEAGLTFEVTKDMPKLKNFYYNMYLPHMLKRHSERSLPISFSECQKLFLKGELLLVKSGQEYLSGNLLVPQGNELWAPILAVNDVDNQLTLGSYATYYFSILLGIQRGYARMDFGDTYPFMQDGLFQFKKGFGWRMRPAKGSGAQVFGVRLSGTHVSVSSFLSAQPFVFMDGKNLSGLVFLDSINDLSVKPFCVLGLSSLFVVSSSGMVSGLKGFKLEKLSVEDCLRNGASALRSLCKFCIEGKYSLYRLTW